MAKKGYGYFYFFDENGVLQMRKLTGKELQIEKVCDTDNPFN